MPRHMPNRWPDWLVGTYCLGSAVVGVAGVWFAGSPSIVNAIGEWWSQAYSSLVIVSGLIGLLGIIVIRRQVTVWAVYGLAFANIIAGLSILAVGGSWQTGIRLLVQPLLSVPGIMGWRFWMAWRSLQRKDDGE